MITVVGTGTGAPLPPDAEAALAGAALVVGARRHLDAASDSLPDGAQRIVLGPLAPALDTVEQCLKGYRERPGAAGRVVVLASGDPGFFGIVRALAERFGSAALDVRPGVSSVAAAFARNGLPWDDAVVVSAHGRDLRTAVNVCRAHPKVAVLTGPGAGPAELGAALARSSSRSSRGRTLVVATALGDPGHEWIERVTPAEAAARDWGPAVNVVLCLDQSRALAPMRSVAGPRPGPVRWALDEDEFEHRDSMISKFEVRALALARLGPRVGDLVWDVGAGSGSVAVECARFGAAVVAVEKTVDGIARIEANAAAHGVDVQAVHGAAPTVLSDLPDPDAVFVGGGGRELPAIVTACARRARRAVVVAMAALDRVPAARAALTGAGFVCDGVLLSSSRLVPLPGDVTRLAATNPVFLLWGTHPAARAEGVSQ
ncbi:precorrin-6y C5,15-methyltransferase (decarboxylating) subunit CbiE [Streptomyces himalayensis]|uniref:Precorrin-6y C5,15-methyltransferase (Decarboxylating) subunit CbiE n=1 Tax=Streptomyces himalayensis subsp. himalayensis TaxID=2756131 RepID=A0A7W0DNM1_9ACTN|nr:precorrin-6y C5,15-methyltransferase (decarboxylating) subunit CbiE [Streptomyces himalayensis]MBA2948404.1 precorrin-6y C5,15-methyltransferase (decarboxylating) subunit CbiE [Streptomyces himalayensis subsp. himalayensis]